MTTRRQIPVIFISALDSPEDEEHGLDLGAVDYITKPFHPPSSASGCATTCNRCTIATCWKTWPRSTA